MVTIDSPARLRLIGAAAACAATQAAAGGRPPPRPEYPVTTLAYGEPYAADGLSNLQLGQATAYADIRFRAQHSGTVSAIKIFLIGSDYLQSNHCDSEYDCYGNGTGGDIWVTLCPDDSSQQVAGAGVPALGSPLGSAEIYEPRVTAQYIDGTAPDYGQNTATSMASWVLLTLSNPVQLQEGDVYHLVFQNRDPNYAVNYVSLDHAYLASDQSGPTETQPNAAYADLASLILPQGSGSWTCRYFETPTYEVRYTDGFAQGNPFYELGNSASGTAIYGHGTSASHEVEETFTVSGGDRVVTKVNFRVAGVGSPSAPLHVRLETAAHVAIQEADLPPSYFTAAPRWSAFTFSAPVTLASGSTYNLVFWSAAPTSANAYALLAFGGSKAMGWVTTFADGKWYYTDQGWTENPPLDLATSNVEAYFTVEPNQQYVEAETGTLDASGAMQIAADPGASGGKFIQTTQAGAGSATYAIAVPSAGQYYLWARVRCPSASADTLAVKVDGASDVFDTLYGGGAAGSWVWAEVNGRGGTANPGQLAPRSFTFASGAHTIEVDGMAAGVGVDELYLTDDGSAVPAPNGQYFEAESGVLAGGMVAASDPNASGGQYIQASTADAGTATYPVSVPVPGTYYLWARVLSPDASHASFFVSVDGASQDVYDTVPAGTAYSGTWTWSRVAGRAGTNTPDFLDPLPFHFFGTGPHTLVIGGRDAGTGLDEFFLTDSAYALPASAGPTQPVTIALQPASQSVVAGGSVVFNAAGVSAEALGYQWYFNGAPIAGATSPRYLLTDVSAANAGAYTCVLANASGGTATTQAAELTVVSTSSPGRLINVSCLNDIAAGGSMTAGFVVGGDSSETVLVRGGGPALAAFGVSNPMADPQITLFDSGGNVVASNAGWGGDAQIAQAAASVGAFAFDPASKDSALLVTLPPGDYTAQVGSVSGGGGSALVEVYEVP